METRDRALVFKVSEEGYSLEGFAKALQVGEGKYLEKVHA